MAPSLPWMPLPITAPTTAPTAVLTPRSSAAAVVEITAPANKTANIHILFDMFIS